MLSRNSLVAAVPVLFSFIWTCGLVAGQDIENGQPKKLVSRKEGEAIVQATRLHRAQILNKPDCSHWVHDVYAEAGLDYEFAASRELFAGIEAFQRVRKAQPGDLIVWPGHVGIVVDPEDHSFYSSVNSGFSISSYVSGYWKSRGVPRFYRYRIDELQSARLLAEAKDYAGAATINAAASSGTTAETTVSARATTYKKSSASSSEPLASANESVADVGAPKNLVSDDEQEGRVRYELGISEDITSDLLVISTSRKPTKEEVRLRVSGFAESDSEKLLQTGSLNREIVIMDRFDVDRIETHGKFGSVELRIKEIGSFTGGRVSLTNCVERVRLGLEQQPEGWILFAPADRIYLPRQAAVKIITARIAVLSRSPADSQQLKSLSRALKILLARGQSRS